MALLTFQRALALGAAMLAAAAWLTAGQQAAEAGHTFDNKHCQSSGTKTCRYVYSAAGKDLPNDVLGVIGQFNHSCA